MVDQAWPNTWRYKHEYTAIKYGCHHCAAVTAFLVFARVQPFISSVNVEAPRWWLCTRFPTESPCANLFTEWRASDAHATELSPVASSMPIDILSLQGIRCSTHFHMQP